MKLANHEVFTSYPIGKKVMFLHKGEAIEGRIDTYLEQRNGDICGFVIDREEYLFKDIIRFLG